MSVTPLNPKRWTRAEYRKAAEVGLIRPEERVELVDGQIVQKMTQNPPHVVAIRRISRRFEGAFGDTHDIRVQAPIALSDLSEPEPDLVAAKGVPEDYMREHPGPSEIDLVIEVCDSTLERDRRFKLLLYAQAGIREVWIVDVEGRRIESHRDPSPGIGFRVATILAETERIAPAFRAEVDFLVAVFFHPDRDYPEYGLEAHGDPRPRRPCHAE